MAVSDKGANGVLAVPAEARTVEPSEHLLECAPELDQLGVTRQHPRGVHVPHPPAARDREAKGERVAGTLILRNGRIEFPRRHAPVMTAVAAPPDPLHVARGPILV